LAQASELKKLSLTHQHTLCSEAPCPSTTVLEQQSRPFLFAIDYAGIHNYFILFLFFKTNEGTLFKF
jgi:hypothetical protein